MAGDALPPVQVQNPGVGEASDVFIRLTLIRTLGVVDARYNRGIAKEIHFDVLDIEGCGSESRVFDLGKKFLLIREFAVPLCVDEATGNEGLEGSRIAVDLRLIPHSLQNKEFALAWIGLLGGHRDRC